MAAKIFFIILRESTILGNLANKNRDLINDCKNRNDMTGSLHEIHLQFSICGSGEPKQSIIKCLFLAKQCLKNRWEPNQRLRFLRFLHDQNQLSKVIRSTTHFFLFSPQNSNIMVFFLFWFFFVLKTREIQKYFIEICNKKKQQQEKSNLILIYSSSFNSQPLVKNEKKAITSISIYVFLIGTKQLLSVNFWPDTTIGTGKQMDVKQNSSEVKMK